MKHLKTRFIFFIAAFLINFFLMKITNAERVEPDWIKTDKGCLVWIPNPKPDESIRWSGECIDGKAEGNGILQFYKNGIERSRYIMTTKNGSLMVKGVMTARVDPSLLDFILSDCDKISSYRHVIGVVDKEIDLSQGHVTFHILEKAAQFAMEKCPRKRPFSNIGVGLFQGDEKQRKEYEYIKDTRDPWKPWELMRKIFKDVVVSARNYEDDKLWWREYRNEALIERESKEKAYYDAQVEALREKAEKQRMEALRVEKERKRTEVRNRFNEFIKKYGVKELPSPSALITNPFVYEGKTVAIVIDFIEMLTPTQGLFMNSEELPFVVSYIPKGLFTSKKRVLLAGQVLGKTIVKLSLYGEVSAPHLKFVGVHFCQNWDCSDIIMK
jgi:hypothetical protein